MNEDGVGSGTVGQGFHLTSPEAHGGSEIESGKRRGKGRREKKSSNNR